MIEMHTHKPLNLAGNALAPCKETVKWVQDVYADP